MSDQTGEGRAPSDARAEDEAPSERHDEPGVGQPPATDATGTPDPGDAGDGIEGALTPPSEPAGAPEGAGDVEVEAVEPPDLAAASADTSPPAPTPDDAEAEQIEWQPVVDGDKIEWQPVVASDPAGYDETTAAAAQPDFEYPEGTEREPTWEAGVSDAAPPVSGNGAAVPTAAVPATPDRPARRPATPARPARAGGPPRSRRPPPPERREEPDDGRAAAKTKRQVIILSILTVLVIAVAIMGFVLSRDAKDKGTEATSPPASGTPSNTIPKLPDAELRTYSDDATGFTVRFAQAWEVLRPPNADIRLVVNAGGNDAFQVRVAPVQTPATVQNIENFKAVTDAIVFGDKTAKPVKEQLVTVNGLLAYYYLFTFHDPVSNSEGVHAQYFVFEGNRMFILTFQSVPADDFAKQAGLWDQIAESFTVQPRPTTTTTAAPPESTTSTSAP